MKVKSTYAVPQLSRIEVQTDDGHDVEREADKAAAE